jgi:ABC-type transport system involved in multi-copper enzyme maturation permease subunit
MVTAAHGVRMQHDYLSDRAGPSGSRLRLTRHGDTVTGEVSADGTNWTVVDTVRLPGLPTTVEVGLFVACPPRVDGLGTAAATATATFGAPRLSGGWSTGDGGPGTGTDGGGAGVLDTGGWRGDQVGAGTATFAGYPPGTAGGFTATGDGFTVTGAGDLAPAGRGDLAVAATAADLLFGTFPALILVAVVATLTMTTEFRYGTIRGTLSADPRRGRVLAAKAVVLAGVTFAVTLPATLLAVPLWLRVVRWLGITVFPATGGALLRAEVGTAALLAVTAVLALAVGTVVRRSAAAVTTVVAVTVLPLLLARTPFLPVPVGQWLTRFTPAAGLAVQQTLQRHPQVDGVYSPAEGYFPLSPWAGLAVLCGYTAVALAVAAVALRRRDA